MVKTVIDSWDIIYDDHYYYYFGYTCCLIMNSHHAPLWAFQPEYQYWHLCPICLNLHAFSLDIWVFDLILDLMHMNSAYFSGIVLMHALFCNLDYWLWYQKTFLRTLISAWGHTTEPGAAYLCWYNEHKESWLLLKPLTFWHYQMPWLKRTYGRIIQCAIHMICMPFPQAPVSRASPLVVCRCWSRSL